MLKKFFLYPFDVQSVLLDTLLKIIIILLTYFIDLYTFVTLYGHSLMQTSYMFGDIVCILGRWVSYISIFLALRNRHSKSKTIWLFLIIVNCCNFYNISILCLTFSGIMQF